MYKNYPDSYVYPAVIEKTGTNYNVYFPDLPGCAASGDTLQQAVQEAKGGLALHLWGIEQDGEQAPEPSFGSLTPAAGETVCYIDVNMFAIRSQMDNRSVKKTLTIPWYLNVLAEQKRINFSQLLQAALKERLGLY